MAILTVEPRHKSRSVGDLVVARVSGGVGAAVDHAEVGVQVEVPSGADGIAQTLGGLEEKSYNFKTYVILFPGQKKIKIQ